MTVKVFAPAKVNLTLHITGQRADGYHLIDSLVAFGPVGDHLTINEYGITSLTVEGPEAARVPADMNNLVMKAAKILADGRHVAMTLEKNLPAASGIGGGSADAAATLRGLILYWWATDKHFEIDDEELKPFAEKILALGADVPMCLWPSPMRATGIGHKLECTANVPTLPTILLNPRVSVATQDVFGALEIKDGDPMPQTLPEWSGLPAFCDWLADQRNDLQEPALALHPEISETLDVLEQSNDVMFARMSGSGATCFAIYPDLDAVHETAAKIRRDNPGWWLATGMVGSKFKESLPIAS